MERLPVSGPWITEREVAYVTDAVRTAWYESANVFQQRFERAFAHYMGLPYAVSLPSCTSALHLALVALGIGPRDEVIVPDLTWIASAAPISYVGATPVFADVDARTWCLSAASVEACITPRTKAIIAVDLYGNPGNVDALEEIARRHGIALIEDAAEAIGSELHDRKSGSFGDAGVFSFHGSKTLTTGEGGMLVTRREDVHQKAIHLADHGRVPGDTMFRNTQVAFKYKMSSLQAALGLAQLERIDELVARKRHIFGWYVDALADYEGISLNHEAPGSTNSYWMVTAVLDPRLGVTKEPLIDALRQQGVDCRPFFYPLSSLPAYYDTKQAHLARERNRVSYELSPNGVNLPSGMNMTAALVSQVCTTLQSAIERQGNSNGEQLRQIVRATSGDDEPR